MQSDLGTLRVAVESLGDPGASLRLITGGREALHRYTIARLLSVRPEELDAVYAELPENGRFMDKMREMTALAGRPLGGVARPSDLYAICRVRRPTTVIETGVASGVSSAYILQALETNGVGALFSIDLPDSDSEALLGKVLTTLPKGKSSGWIVPEWLRSSRWDLRIGRSADLLPSLLQELGEVDIFLHDSEHSSQNMTFEFNQVWPRLPRGGMILSDDVNLPSSRGAFYDFATKVNRKPARLYAGMGAIKK